MKALVLVCLVSPSLLLSCTQSAKHAAANEEAKKPAMALAAKTEAPNPDLKRIETLFDTYKKSHIEKSLETLKTVYPEDLAIKGIWKGNPVPSSKWMENRKKFMTPIKSVEFSDTLIFKNASKNSYVVVYKEKVETFDKKTTVYFGQLESSVANEGHFFSEEISLKSSDYDRWAKDRVL
jgi:hypothetical protein